MVRGREAGSGSRHTEKLSTKQRRGILKAKTFSLFSMAGVLVFEGSSSSHLELVHLKKDRMADWSAAVV